jgi:threonine dehydrogenase-like Zn-dependent dehydrogenase
MLARASGASKIILAGPNQARLDLGREIGADVIINTRKKDLVKEVMDETDGRGVDYVFEAAGAQGSLEGMGKVVANKGTINIYSVPVEPADNIDFAEYLFKDITLVTSSGAQNSFERGIKIVASGIVDIEKVITHTFPLEDIEKAFEVVEKRLDGVGKAVVMVDPDLK